MKNLKRVMTREYKIVVNGMMTPDGERQAIRLHGDVEATKKGQTLYDLLVAVAERAGEEFPEMGYPDSVQVTLYPPPDVEPRARQHERHSTVH